jgi:hypothetical protein
MARSFGKYNASPGTSTDKIRNIGPKSAAWLRQVGIRTDEDVKRFGALESFIKVKKAGFKAGLNLLYALAGAEDDCHWQEIGDARKHALLDAFNSEVDKQPKVKNGFPSKHGALGARLFSQSLASTDLANAAVDADADADADADGESESEPDGAATDPVSPAADASAN